VVGQVAYEVVGRHGLMQEGERHVATDEMST
jgi:hypothetical protein